MIIVLCKAICCRPRESRNKHGACLSFYIRLYGVWRNLLGGSWGQHLLQGGGEGNVWIPHLLLKTSHTVDCSRQLHYSPQSQRSNSPPMLE